MRFENNENKPTNTKGMWKIEGMYYNKGSDKIIKFLIDIVEIKSIHFEWYYKIILFNLLKGVRLLGIVW